MVQVALVSTRVAIVSQGDYCGSMFWPCLLGRPGSP